MKQSEVFGAVVEILEKLKIKYMIVGSIASTFYGRPRLTYDMDILIDLKEDRLETFTGSFGVDWYADAGMVREALAKNMPFNFIHAPSGIKIDFFPAGNGEFEKAQFINKVEQQFDDERTASFSSAEDVIIKKLDYYRESGSEKHLDDIAGIMEIQGAKLNIGYIDEWSEKKGTLEIWKRIKTQREGT